MKITSNPRSGVAWLKRLTEGEYFEEKSKIAENLKRKLALQRQVAQDAQAIEATVTPPMSMPVSPSQTISNSIKTAEVRTDIQSKLHKLSLFFDSNPSVAQYGIDPISFIEWADAAQLSHDEIDMILGHPSVMKSPDIKTALLKKKASL